MSQKEQLVTELKQHRADEAMLKDQLDKTVQKYSTLCKEHEELQHLIKSNEVQLQLNNAKTKVMELKSSYEKLDLIKIHMTDKVNIHMKLYAIISFSHNFPPIKLP